MTFVVKNLFPLSTGTVCRHFPGFFSKSRILHRIREMRETKREESDDDDEIIAMIEEETMMEAVSTLSGKNNIVIILKDVIDK